MRFSTVAGNLGAILRLFSISLLFPALVSFLYREPGFDLLGVHVPWHGLVFLVCFALVLGTGLFLGRVGRAEEFRDYEAFVLVASGWLVVAAFGALPYVFTGTVLNPLDAYFESMSGFTTTGASILEYPLEQYSKSVLFWRSLTQWIGGMGIIVLSVAVLGRLTEGGARLMSAELPGGTVTRLKPRITQTARLLWEVYLALSILLFGLLAILFHWKGLSWPDAVYDAVVHTFSTLSTGGFSTRTDSIGFYRSHLVNLVVTVFMLVGSMNFTLLYFALRREGRRLRDDPELRFLGTMFVVLTVFLAATVYFAASFESAPGEEETVWATIGGRSVGNAVSHAMFQTATIISTTGYATADFGQWPQASQMLLLFLMFVGGSTGSTAGSIKLFRILLLLKLVVREVTKAVHPRALIPVRLSGEVVEEEFLARVSAFFFAYMTVFLFASVLLALLGLDLVSAASAVAACLGNIGPGFGVVGPSFTYQNVPDAGRLVLIFVMWVGRLEIFTALVLFFPSTYQR
ncbi:MAG: TrkH family potassium uptake protein [Methanobacteriota archaeon]